VAILTVISTAIGILESILYSKGAFMYLVRVFWKDYSKDTSLHEVRENCKKNKVPQIGMDFNSFHIPEKLKKL
jgi:hypothetical protein